MSKGLFRACTALAALTALLLPPTLVNAQAHYQRRFAVDSPAVIWTTGFVEPWQGDSIGEVYMLKQRERSSDDLLDTVTIYHVDQYSDTIYSGAYPMKLQGDTVVRFTDYPVYAYREPTTGVVTLVTGYQSDD